ncbi:MAG TPA: hypothetical protein VLT16_14960, partial [Candidatus Limnocylindrales bacterium]|nr:hypothetical protein [Candidatus Limnocylindrales bacterium]
PSPTPAAQHKAAAAQHKAPTAQHKVSAPAPAKAPAVNAHHTAVKAKPVIRHSAAPPASAAGKTAGAQVAAGKKAAPAPGKTGPAASTGHHARPRVTTGTLPAAKKKAGTQAPAVSVRSVKPATATPAHATKKAAVHAPKPAVSARAKTKVKAAVPPSGAKVAGVPHPAKPEKKPQPRLIGSAGRRDPFVSPIRCASSVSPTASCTSGKRCLAIPELVLQGTVRDISGKMLAVVATSTHRTYTLRENDQVFNGSVEKITSDSIIFREYVKDALGRESAREVVKKLGPAS